jgi:hypothetical protein
MREAWGNKSLTEESFLEYIKQGFRTNWEWALKNGRTGLRRKRMGKKIERLGRFFKDFFVGIAYFEIEQTVRQEKGSRQNLFLLLTFGDLLGVPVFSPYYSLRMLPHIYPALDSWKKGMLRERDLTEVKSL